MSADRLMRKYFKKLMHLARQIVAHFWKTQSLMNAASLAYTTLLSIVPLMILSLGIFSLFPSFKSYLNETHEFLFQHFVPTSATKR